MAQRIGMAAQSVNFDQRRVGMIRPEQGGRSVWQLGEVNGDYPATELERLAVHERCLLMACGYVVVGSVRVHF